MEFRDLKKQYKALKSEMDARIATVINSANFISGFEVEELEQKLAAYVGVKYCITCANGTDAITLALMAWNIKKKDAVFVPNFTFFASGECPAYQGATPIFVDVDRYTYNISPEKLEESIIQVKKEGKYTPKVVIAVDLFGLPADYQKIKIICEKYHLLLLEDGAQGFGGMIGEKKACSFGDISTTSFFPAKPLGCYGDGGAVFTNNDEWADLIKSYRIHGQNKKDKYNNVRIGINSRLDTIQAAVLLVKIEAFKNYELNNINQIANMYTERLSDIPDLVLPIIKNDFASSWAQYTIQLPEEVERAEVQAKLKEKEIPTMVYYKKPMHLQKAFVGTDSAIANCPVTESLCKKVLSIPIHPYLNESEIVQVVESIRELFDLKNN